jgi:hypothetical protein
MRVMCRASARGTSRALVTGMLLTVLFVVTGVVGAVVLLVEVGAVIRRRRIERDWRNRHGQDRN